jgi:hypothetical protein
MSNACIDALQREMKPAVLERRDARYAAGRDVRSGGNGKTRANERAVPGKRVVEDRIETALDAS